jgi:hypothetical protein
MVSTFLFTMTQYNYLTSIVFFFPMTRQSTQFSSMGLLNNGNYAKACIFILTHKITTRP